MILSGELARLKKLTREVLLKEVLREFQGDFEGVVDAINWWRLDRHTHTTTAEAEHYVLTDLDCDCSFCKRMHSRLRATVAPQRPELSADWVSSMFMAIEKLAPGMTARGLKFHLLQGRMFQGRTEEQLIHFVRNGHFLTHTPDQAEAERRLKEWTDAQGITALVWR